MMTSRALALVGTAILLLSTSIARADDETPEKKAEHLFDEAKELAEKGNYADACPKLEESQKLDPALGTQFNLADCYEHVGRTATAWQLFNEVATAARAAGKGPREKAARGRMATLDPVLARVKVIAPTAPGLEVKIDAHALTAAELEAGYAVDPGDHAVAASANERKPWTGNVTGKPSATTEITVPELEVIVHPPLDLGMSPAPEPPRGGTQRTIALIVGGVGIAGLAVGGVAGLMAISKHDDAKARCEDPKRCPDADSAALWTDATSAGTVSTIGFVAGGVALAGAAVLWLTAPSGSSSATRAKSPASSTVSSWRVAPSVASNGGGLFVLGTLP
ncbi:MAG: hypothetical protein JWM74_348 [Myxococcaceae bacterium]|nr:hypothetical protein [Myxococcaceae bacterium]